MQTTTLRPVKTDIQYLADQLSKYDEDILVNAKYVKDSIDYNDHKLTSWFGKSSVELKQVEDILRAYVQLVIENYITEYSPNGYPADYMEKIGAAATQESTLALRCMKIMYWGVKQNRIPTNAILYPKNKANDPTYRIPSEPGFLENLAKNAIDTGGRILNGIGALASNTVDAANKIVDGTGDTFEGLGVLGKYGVPIAVGSAAMVIVYFGYNIAKTTTADKVIKVVDKMPSKNIG